MIDLTNDVEKQRELALQLRMRAAFEISLSKKAYSLLNSMANDVSKKYEQNGMGGLQTSFLPYIEKFTILFEKFYSQIAKNFAKRFDDELKKSFISYEKKQTLFEELISSFIDYIAPIRADLIVGTTQEQTFDVIRDGIDNQLSVYEISRNIYDKIGGDSARSRARTIAITETHIASNQSNFLMAKSTPIIKTKEWLATEDSSTRPDHAKIDGTSIPIADTFIVGGEYMNAPGDPNASAKQVVNCRCTLIYGTR